MDNDEHINKLVHDALNSLDNAERAMPKPYLLTRLNARMRHSKETGWDRALKFINRPVVALAGIGLVIALNAIVVTNNYPAKTTAVSEEQYASADEYNSSVAVLNDIENIEP